LWGQSTSLDKVIKAFWFGVVMPEPLMLNEWSCNVVQNMGQAYGVILPPDESDYRVMGSYLTLFIGSSTSCEKIIYCLI
jgi:hypothetical protein